MAERIEQLRAWIAQGAPMPCPVPRGVAGFNQNRCMCCNGQGWRIDRFKGVDEVCVCGGCDGTGAVTPKRLSNPAYKAAFSKGYIAACSGGPKRNPYGDDRTCSGSVTFARAFWKAWERGWEKAQQDIAAGDTGGWSYERFAEHGEN